MGTASKMGPAYFPTVLGGLLALIGLISIVRSLLRPGEPLGVFAYKGAALVLIPMVLFGGLVRGTGIVIALVVLVIMSAYASIKFRWGPSVALAIGLAVFSVLVFIKGLGIPLPLLGPWFGG
jgi:putative tricarboxylic transport membrane protein